VRTHAQWRPSPAGEFNKIEKAKPFQPKSHKREVNLYFVVKKKKAKKNKRKIKTILQQS
jgi:hypothetical protein